MAKLYVTEYRRMFLDHAMGHPVPVPVEPPEAEQALAVGGTSVQSAVFATNTKFIRMHSDVVCSRVIGADPTATVDAARMAAGATEYVAVEQGHKIAVIANS